MTTSADNPENTTPTRALTSTTPHPCAPSHSGRHRLRARADYGTEPFTDFGVSSGPTRITVPGHAAYGAVKGTVEVLTRYQAKELGGRGTRINTIAPRSDRDRLRRRHDARRAGAGVPHLAGRAGPRG
ncbi:SDR family oxidoreductase [Streptomyces sp. NPDC002088]|uniref:SDR family oxidoreductase n=1 Tax=Streptomyces sp. NPDC002088 TaxID=3154665 RepID=UPI003325C5A2